MKNVTQAKRSMRIVDIRGAGFIGAHLVDTLVNNG